MTGISKPQTKYKWLFIVLSIMLTGILLVLSNSLNGTFWYLLWIAPIPVLVISWRVPGKIAFLASFAAGLIGRLVWFIYLETFAPPVFAALITLFLALTFAATVTLTRMIFLRSRPSVAVFAYPVITTSVEFLLLHFSYDGSAGSIAYSQADFLPLIQIASITGISGITFFVTLVPSIMATGLHYRFNKPGQYAAIALPSIMAVSVIAYGTIRISGKAEPGTIQAGLIVLDEDQYSVTNNPLAETETIRAGKYITEVEALAALGVRIILLPERAFSTNDSLKPQILHLMQDAASKLDVQIVAGYANFGALSSVNCAFATDRQGKILIDYTKVHLVKGLEREFTPGTQRGYFTVDGKPAGLAVCKDLDYPALIREYGKYGISILLVPAWDFRTDDWLHSRMAIMRSVENGFPMIRAARLGRLTINDRFGRVTAEKSCSDGRKAILSAVIPQDFLSTFYSKTGEWFPLLNLTILLAFAGPAFFIRLKKK